MALHQCLKVDGHDVVAVDDGLRLRDLRRLLRRDAAGGRCRGGIRRRAAAPGDAQELAEVQPEGGEDAEALHRLLRDELLPVEVAGGDGPPVIPADQQHRQKLHRRRDAHRQGHGLPGDTALRQQPPSPEEVESTGGQDHEKRQPGPGHAAQGLPPELQHLSRAPHGVEGQEGAEDGEVDRLGPQPEGAQHRQDAGGGAPSPAGAEGAEEICHPAEGQREEDGIAEAALRAEGIEVDGQLLHGEHCREPQPEEPGWDFPFLPFSARHGVSPLPPGASRTRTLETIVREAAVPVKESVEDRRKPPRKVPRRTLPRDSQLIYKIPLYKPGRLYYDSTVSTRGV